MSAASLLGAASTVLGPAGALAGALSPGGGGPSQAEGAASSLSDGLMEVNNQIGGTFAVGSGSKAEGAKLESTQRQESNPTLRSEPTFASSSGSSMMGGNIPSDNTMLYLILGVGGLIIFGGILISAGRSRK